MVSWYNYVWKLVIKLNYEIIDVKQEEKEKLYKLLQYALYDGSQYIDNDINFKATDFKDFHSADFMGYSILEADTVDLTGNDDSVDFYSSAKIYVEKSFTNDSDSLYCTVYAKPNTTIKNPTGGKFPLQVDYDDGTSEETTLYYFNPNQYYICIKGYYYSFVKQYEQFEPLKIEQNSIENNEIVIEE